MRSDNMQMAQACKDKDEDLQKISQANLDLKNKNDKTKKLLITQKKAK